MGNSNRRKRVTKLPCLLGGKRPQSALFAGRKMSPVRLFVDDARKDLRAPTVHGAYKTRVLCVIKGVFSPPTTQRTRQRNPQPRTPTTQRTRQRNSRLTTPITQSKQMNTNRWTQTKKSNGPFKGHQNFRKYIYIFFFNFFFIRMNANPQIQI